MNSVIYADIISALQLAKVIGCIQTRYGEVRISEREALEKYRFSRKTLKAFEDLRDGAVKRTGGKPNLPTLCTHRDRIDRQDNAENHRRN